ncbi:ROK family protein [Paenibacillus sp. GD4]|uniref:ROK family protein n=1 Tax=Paenibacillus sp. GD4 TaxID=3068890 RepID=UPI002796D328|nr:ROK family protein [Paenibacillus sp. GD4]MDQ1911847.1 ROK family protein [Paenibacillus sp. GD4]
MHLLGIDIGGTSVKGIVCNEWGEICHEARNPTDISAGRDAILGSVHKTVSELLSAYPDAVSIGIGTAGRVNADTGEVVYATSNLPGWQGTNLSDWGMVEFGLPVKADNDANAALLGEAWVGAARGVSDAVMLTLGTGVGGAIMTGGKLVRGAHWNGGEWGHVVLVPGGIPCNCGRRGCIEQYLSGTALVRHASEHGGGHYLHGEEVFKAAANGNPGGSKALRDYISLLTVVIDNMMVITDPQVIILGGGVADAKELWWPALQESLQGAGSCAVVRPAELGNLAGSLGAAKLALDTLVLR